MTAIWEAQPGPTPPLQDEPPNAPTGSSLPPFTAPTETGSPNPAPWTGAPPSFPGTTGAGYSYSAPTPPPPLPPTSSSPPTRRGSGRRAAYAVVGVTALVGLGFGAGLLVRHDDRPASPAPLAAAPATVAQTSQQASTPLVQDNSEEPAAAVAEALGPAVVQIELGQGLGSGVIYDKSGLILTNAHVVAGSGTGGQSGANEQSDTSGSKVTVRLKDGSSLPGTVLGADSQSDIAVVKVTPPGELPVAWLAEDKAKVGQMTIGIGSPFGLQETVTAGIVSAVDRPVEGEAGISINMLQTDAPINPGNSGGALANRRGEVIGINSAIYSQKGENNGIGFAIPIQTAKAVADKIVSGESLDHAYLGVSSKPATNGQAGAAVVSVSPNSPAADAGLQTGDVVTSVDNQPIKDSQDLSATIVGHTPGDKVLLQVRRSDGSTATITVQLGTRPPTSANGTGSGSQNPLSPPSSVPGGSNRGGQNGQNGQNGN